MSDIGFYGLEAALVSIAMLAIAGGAFLIETLLWRRRKRQRKSKPPAQARFAPLLYGMLGLGLLYTSEEGSLAWKRNADDWAWVIGGVGLLLWVGMRIGTAGWRRRRREMAS